MQSAYLSGLPSSAVRPRLNRTPLWNEGADEPCEPGLWAVEPRIAKGATSA
ncbi:hypothetical protein [Streptomyces sp. NRRL B-24720]|uniref:hypothetical protein n=1 Tax=Streptomyces sp. NRRL B-24720 TaxID=1476876 RepID=UPI001F43D74F|nr:hypothetical protein [Streptomyces sp. NRRL B-24720]